MTKCLLEDVNRELTCEDPLVRLYGLRTLDEQVLRLLFERDEPLAVDDIAELVGRERTTVYRSVRRLAEARCLHEEKVTTERGGYYHTYRPADPDRIAADMRRTLDDWYVAVNRLLREFEDGYGTVARDVPEESPDP